MHRVLARISALGAAVPVALALLGTAPALAQFGGGAPTGTGTGTSIGAGQRSMRGPQKVEPAPPPVLPGTKRSPEAAAPTQALTDMSPTDALFDAINRGDLPAARDAVNRGANLEGRNVLGLTPLDLAVDLGRNEISFLLLSMRNEDPGARRDAQTDNILKPAARHAAPAPRFVSRAGPGALPPRESETPVAAVPRLYSGNGGAPIPQVGFLGFDEGRSVR